MFACALLALGGCAESHVAADPSQPDAAVMPDAGPVAPVEINAIRLVAIDAQPAECARTATWWGLRSDSLVPRTCAALPSAPGETAWSCYYGPSIGPKIIETRVYVTGSEASMEMFTLGMSVACSGRFAVELIPGSEDGELVVWAF